MTEAIIIALLGLIGTVTAAYYTTKHQNQKNTQDRNRRLDDREAAFWKRADERDEKQKKRIDDLETELKNMEAIIAEQGAVILSLRARVQTLERENGRLKAENERLKSGAGKKGM